MITLITGAPGCGKTAFAVKLFTESEYYPGSAVLFNVRGWKGGGVYHESPSARELYEQPRTIYLVDEAQTFWPSRVAGRPQPEIVDHLAKHRHVSQDWILTAQHPGQLEIGIRRLVGRHVHLTRTPLGVRFSEAGECRDDLKFSRDENRKYAFPTESLRLYQSDEGVTQHQKKGLKLPKRLIFLVGLIGVLGAVIYYFAGSSDMFQTIAGDAKKSDEAKGGGGMFSGVGGGGGRPSGQQSEVLPLTHAPHHFYFLPRNPVYPEIARAPRFPISCVASSRRCVCFDQKNQEIEGMGEDRCRAIVAGRDQLAVLNPAPVNPPPAPVFVDPSIKDKPDTLPREGAGSGRLGEAPEGPSAPRPEAPEG